MHVQCNFPSVILRDNTQCDCRESCCELETSNRTREAYHEKLIFPLSLSLALIFPNDTLRQNKHASGILSRKARGKKIDLPVINFQLTRRHRPHARHRRENHPPSAHARANVLRVSRTKPANLLHSSIRSTSVYSSSNPLLDDRPRIRRDRRENLSRIPANRNCREIPRRGAVKNPLLIDNRRPRRTLD